MRGALVLIVLAASLAVPAVAAADNTLTVVRGDAVFRSEDPGVDNQFVVENAGTSEVRFFEPVDPYGMSGYPPQCRPGRTRTAPDNSIVPTEVFCPRTLVTGSVTVEAGPAEDDVRYSVSGVPGIVSGDTGMDKVVAGATNDFVSGDQGNDNLDGGAGDDELHGEDGADVIAGGDGNDKLFGGSGADTLDAGPGDDTLQTNDGAVDKVACGPGTDSVVADTVDELTDCENAQRQFVAPPSDQPAADDNTKPRLQVGGSTYQRISGKRRSIRIAATSSEKGLIQVAGFLQVAGINDRLEPVRKRITVAGGGTQIVLKFSKRQLRMLRRDFRRGRTPRARLTISAVDAAGNTSRAKHMRIRLYGR